MAVGISAIDHNPFDPTAIAKVSCGRWYRDADGEIRHTPGHPLPPGSTCPDCAAERALGNRTPRQGAKAWPPESEVML